MERGSKANRKIPCSLDILVWTHTDFFTNGLKNPRARGDIYTARTVIFLSVKNRGRGRLRMSGIRLGRGGNNASRLALTTRNRKTDRFDDGDYKL